MTATLALNNLTLRYSNGLPVVSDLTITLESTEFVALLGPSGSGKSTILRAIAGFLTPDPTSDLFINNQSIVSLAPEQRNVALVFQQPHLFPHLNVLHNVAFGLRMRNVAPAQRTSLAQQALAAVQLSDLQLRRPHQLSGGQQQRVALARALVTQPQVLLLDEPFSALDPELRDEMRLLVRRLQREQGVTTLLVTHDQQEAAQIADRIALLINGRLQQVGPPSLFYERPENLAVARFFGAQNLLPATLLPDQAHAETALGTLPIAPTTRTPGPVTLVIRPEYIRLSRDHEPQSLPGQIHEHQFLGALQRYTVAVGAQTLVVLTLTAEFQPGDQVSVGLPAERIWAVA
jgi:ABC-type Fe3+/spermidine/putrescine transport system ATPase subunit